MEVAEQKEEDEEISNIVPFARPATGGSGPPEGPEWLGKLEKGTVFLVRDKQDNSSCFGTTFQVISKLAKSTRLYNHTSKHLWALNKEFSKRFELIEILGKVLDD